MNYTAAVISIISPNQRKSIQCIFARNIPSYKTFMKLNKSYYSILFIRKVCKIFHQLFEIVIIVLIPFQFLYLDLHIYDCNMTSKTWIKSNPRGLENRTRKSDGIILKDAE